MRNKAIVMIICLFVLCLRLCLIGVAIIIGIKLFVLSGMIFMFTPDPPAPKVTYTEFPFCITYEYNGQEIVYEDVQICEYGGIVDYGSGGKRYVWNTRLKSGNREVILIEDTDVDGKFKICVFHDDPEYLMNDPFYREMEEEYLRFKKIYVWRENFGSKHISVEEAYEIYDFRIINVECAEPILNVFSEVEP